MVTSWIFRAHVYFTLFHYYACCRVATKAFWNKLFCASLDSAGFVRTCQYTIWLSESAERLSCFVYLPTINLVNYIKSLNVPVICFPRGIKNYKIFCSVVKPDGINIDYNVNPISICREIDIPVQGGLDPKILLTDVETLKKGTLEYLNIFKDHPYIFNLGHGVLPQTDPNMVDYLVKTVKDY